MMRTTCVFMLFLAALARAQAPVITAAAEGWDFGVREQGEIETKRIAITNEGDADLVVQSVKVTCGCVKGHLEKMTLAPGESTDLVLRLNTAGQIGRIRKFAYIQSNDPEKKSLILYVNGQVRGKWDVSSPNMVFDAEAGEVVEQVLKLTVREGETVRLRRTYTKSSHFSISTEEHRSGDGAKGGRITGYDVKIKMLGNCPPGTVSGVLRLETTDSQVPYRNISLNGRIRGVAKVTPSRLYVGRIFHGGRKTVQMKVTRKDGGEFEVKGGSSDLEYVKVHILPIREKHEYDVLVTVVPSEEIIDIIGRVTILTDIEGSQEMTVDLEGRAAPK